MRTWEREYYAAILDAATAGTNKSIIPQSSIPVHPWSIHLFESFTGGCPSFILGHPPTIDDGPRKGPYLSIGGGGFLSIVPVPHRIQKNLLGPIYSLPLHRKAPTILWATICMNIFGFNSGPPSRKCLGAGCESRNTRLRFTVSPTN